MSPILVLHVAAEPVSVLTDKKQIPAAEGLQGVTSCHQPHMLPTEELLGNTNKKKNTSSRIPDDLFFFQFDFDNNHKSQKITEAASQERSDLSAPTNFIKC